MLLGPRTCCSESTGSVHDEAGGRVLAAAFATVPFRGAHPKEPIRTPDFSLSR